MLNPKSQRGGGVAGVINTGGRQKIGLSRISTL
jgi:hypothetical protein